MERTDSGDDELFGDDGSDVLDGGPRQFTDYVEGGSGGLAHWRRRRGYAHRQRG